MESGSPNSKQCRGCNSLKSISEFYRYKDGVVYSRCKSCQNTYTKAWREKNPERHRQLSRKSRDLNRDAINRRHNDWYWSNPDRRDKQKTAASSRYQKLRIDVLREYGGACKCCGESNKAFLSVDHISNNGSSHRREIGRGGLYPWLRQRGYPKDNFQLLCYNCNFAKRTTGTCPHKDQAEYGLRITEL